MTGWIVFLAIALLMPATLRADTSAALSEDLKKGLETSQAELTRIETALTAARSQGNQAEVTRLSELQVRYANLVDSYGRRLGQGNDTGGMPAAPQSSGSSGGLLASIKDELLPGLPQGPTSVGGPGGVQGGSGGIMDMLKAIDWRLMAISTATSIGGYYLGKMIMPGKMGGMIGSLVGGVVGNWLGKKALNWWDNRNGGANQQFQPGQPPQVDPVARWTQGPQLYPGEERLFQVGGQTAALPAPAYKSAPSGAFPSYSTPQKPGGVPMGPVPTAANLVEAKRFMDERYSYFKDSQGSPAAAESTPVLYQRYLEARYQVEKLSQATP